MASDGKNVTVIVKGKSYQWFNPSIIRTNAGSEDFIHVLRSNIAHYFGVPVDYQVLCDKAGLLVGHADLVRFLVHPMPQLWVYDGRQMSKEEKATTLSKLSSLSDDVGKLRACLNTRYEGASNTGILSNGSVPVDTGGGGPRLGSPISQAEAGSEEYSTEEGGGGGGGGAGGLAPPSPLDEGSRASVSGENASARRPTFGEPRLPPAWMPEEVEGASTSSTSNIGALDPRTAGVGTPRASVSPTRLPQGPTAPIGNGFQPSSPSRPTSPAGASDSDRFIEIFLQKDAADSRYGFAGVPAEDGRDLLVTWVDPSGLLARWNATNPDRAVLPGAWIVAVNHEHERADGMLAQLQSPSVKILARTSGGGPPRQAAAKAAGGHPMSPTSPSMTTFGPQMASPTPTPMSTTGTTPFGSSPQAGAVLGFSSPLPHLSLSPSPSAYGYRPGRAGMGWPSVAPAVLAPCGGGGMVMPGATWNGYPLPSQQAQQW